MRFIEFGGGYINVEHISSIHSENMPLTRKCIVTLVNGSEFSEQSSNDLRKALIDKILDSNSGFKGR